MPQPQGKSYRLEEKGRASVDEFENQDTRQNNSRQQNSSTEEPPSSQESASAASVQSGSPIPERCIIEVTGLPDGASEDLYENQDTCRNNSRQRNSSTEEPSSSQESASAASVQSESPIPEHCIIEVTGLPDGASEDLVTNYFENVRRSKGGPVSSVVMTPELRKCLVTFESPDDAERTINHSSHVLSGARLQVSLFVEEDESADEFGENEGEDQDLDEEDSITIIVSDIPSSTSEDAVTFYFENSRRSGGGDVSEIHYKDSGEAVITFSEVKDLQRLLEEPHKIDGQIITVIRQPPLKKVPLDPLRLHVQGLSVTTSKDCLSFYLEKFADVEVEEVYLGVKNNALAVFESEPEVTSYSRKHRSSCVLIEKLVSSLCQNLYTVNYTRGNITVLHILSISDFESLLHKVNKDKKGLEGKKPRLERVPVCSCILVTGLKRESSDHTIDLYFDNEKRSGGRDVSRVERIRKDQALDLVTNYFENAKRSKGGPVSSVVMTPELRKCLVTFESPDDAERTINHSSHVLSGEKLQVSLFVEEDESAVEFDENKGEDEDLDKEGGITIVASGILSSTSKDTVILYFENSRRSGGGDVFDVHYNDKGEAVITFSEVKDLQRLLEGPHKIDDRIITVVRQPPPKKVPLDPLRLHVQGISKTTTKDCLSFYLEKFAEVAVEEVYLGFKDNALAVFESEPDFESLLQKVNNDKKGLEGKKPRIERVPVCSCILVTGLKRESTDHTIDLYFDNEKRSGGRDVSRVERIRKDQALVHFEDHTSVQDVIARGQREAHKIDGVELEVMPYYPFLENAASKRMEVTFDPDIYKYIKVHHKSELQTLLEKYSVEAELSDGSILIISPADSKCDTSWEEGAESFKSFLFNFKKSEISVPSEIFDEVSKRWQLQCSSQGTANFLLSFDNHRGLAVILGKKTVVEQEEEKLKELMTEVKQDSELMKSVVEVVETNYSSSRLTLLEMSGLCNKLADEYRHLSINVDSVGEKLCFKGPRKNIQEVKLEVVTFISKIIERTTEQPTGIIDVLRQQHVSIFIQELFEKKSIQAVILLDQGRNSNEVQVVGVDAKNAKEAEAILQDSLKEKSIHLKPENTQVINSHEWKDFQLSMTSNFKVGIAVDASVSNVWISGITDDVDNCSDQVQKFLEKNTIFHNVVQVEEGTARFIATLWEKKLEAIKGELSNCYVDMRVTSDYTGIEVSGTAEGMAKTLQDVDA
ncbi:hypothetical protein pdam_00011104 [Pocillopora damicornis]|uniref:RRM domain-containing protein n=1 Tax=Pocillopora damicornis TaxID=46731 RepID=A0A3M6U402_POCDA|nr:hypothetical protein pdam_00011104 [Pocillopora damicornis]